MLGECTRWHLDPLLRTAYTLELHEDNALQPESGAILIYLSEHVAGITDKADKAAIWKWVCFAQTSLVSSVLSLSLAKLCCINVPRVR